MKVKTISSNQTWQSPDGQRTIWEVQLKGDDNNDYRLKTYSKEISQVGFDGEVESYLDKKGDRFVKQPAPEGGYKGGGGNNAARLEQDKAKQKEIRAEWAIAKALQASGSPFPLNEEALQQVQDMATKFYVMVDSVIETSGEKVAQ